MDVDTVAGVRAKVQCHASGPCPGPTLECLRGGGRKLPASSHYWRDNYWPLMAVASRGGHCGKSPGLGLNLGYAIPELSKSLNLSQPVTPSPKGESQRECDKECVVMVTVTVLAQTCSPHQLVPVVLQESSPCLHPPPWRRRPQGCEGGAGLVLQVSG